MSPQEEELDRLDVAEILEDFLQGTGDQWDWDDFTQGRPPLPDPDLEAIRRRCASLGKEFPPTRPGWYCSEEGLKVLRSYITALRQTRSG